MQPDRASAAYPSVRPWPEGVGKKGVTKAFVAAYREAFDADPGASFCAGEIDGVTIIVARGYAAERLQHFVEDILDGVIQRKEATADA